jgi:glycosyltransferase involved in cell wall biosynthesis
VRILLIAYDFPPLASPQAIRWHYLTRELARLGAEVHVLAPDLALQDTGIPVPEGVVVHRCDAGGLAGWLARRSGRRRVEEVGEEAKAPARVATTGRPGLNWKGRLHRRLDRLIGMWSYPDSRGQWLAPARAALQRLLPELRPDVVICSHEPAVSLEVGLQAAGVGAAWLADLGDPVLAPYTPRRWRARARKLEAQVCAAASAISVTTESTRQLLMDRHGVVAERVFILTQGYDDRQPHTPWRPSLPSLEQGNGLHLLYTGRFYPFRDPMALLEAVVAQPRVRLTIVAPELQPEHLEVVSRSGGRIVFLGEQPHDRVLALQRDCDVLVNIGNALQAQTPGKLFEYLGSGRPILHCASVDDDPANALILEWGRGWVCRNDKASLKEFLQTLSTTPERLCATLAREDGAVAGYGWSAIARRLFRRCEQLIRPAA